MLTKSFNPNQCLIVLAFVFLLLTTKPIQSSAQENKKKITVRFVDSKNKPVENVRAYRYENGKAKIISTTGGIGLITRGDGLIVARKDGFQFSGALFKTDAANTTVVMLTPEETGFKCTTQPLPISKETKQEVIEAIEETFWATLKAKPKDPQNVSTCMRVLCSLNPEKSLQYIEANPLGGRMGDIVKNEVIKVYAKSDFETAIELTNSIK